MIYYPGQNKEKRILKKNLEIVISEIFLKCNMNNDDSYLLSKSLVHSDLRGIHSHGVIRVPEYVSKLIDEVLIQKESLTLLVKKLLQFE